MAPTPSAVSATKTAKRRGRPKKTAPAKTTSKGRLRRRSPAEIAMALTAVVELVKKNPRGLRAEQIRGALKMRVERREEARRVRRETFALRLSG